MYCHNSSGLMKTTCQLDRLVTDTAKALDMADKKIYRSVINQFEYLKYLPGMVLFICLVSGPETGYSDSEQLRNIQFNTGALQLAPHNPYHGRTKHSDIRYHICEYVELG